MIAPPPPAAAATKGEAMADLQPVRVADLLDALTRAPGYPVVEHGHYDPDDHEYTAAGIAEGAGA